MRTIVLHSYDRNGFDTETCHNMDEVKEYLDRPHIGYVHAYIDGCWEKHFLVPKGLGKRVELDWEDKLYR